MLRFVRHIAKRCACTVLQTLSIALTLGGLTLVDYRVMPEVRESSFVGGLSIIRVPKSPSWCETLVSF